MCLNYSAKSINANHCQRASAGSAAITGPIASHLTSRALDSVRLAYYASVLHDEINAAAGHEKKEQPVLLVRDGDMTSGIIASAFRLVRQSVGEAGAHSWC
jgi:hypothetical protein